MRVIFHGDDFGLTAGVNHGIINAYQHGLLTSTSLMAVGEAAEEAMGLAVSNPGLDVGIHLVLVDEPPLLPPTALSTFVSHNGLLPSRNRVLKAIFSQKLDYGQVEAECCAQVEKVLAKGIRITHLDSHQFIHLFPGIFRVCRNIARRYHIPFVRGAMMEPLLKGALTDPEIGPGPVGAMGLPEGMDTVYDDKGVFFADFDHPFCRVYKRRGTHGLRHGTGDTG